MSGRRRSESEHGFTLIELLVVISVVVLLMALLLPALSRARKQARAVACQGNLRQWGILSSMYAAEYGDQLIDHGFFMDWTMPSGWYGDRKDLYLCPAATRSEMPKNSPVDASGEGGTFLAWWSWLSIPGRADRTLTRGSYGMNWHTAEFHEDAFDGLINSPAEREAVRKHVATHWNQARMKEPAEIPILFDCISVANAPLEKDEPPAYPEDFTIGAPCGPPPAYKYNSMRYACIDRHGNGSINVLFADGSVRKVGLKELWTLKWHRLYDTNGPWTKAGGVLPEDWPKWMRKCKDY